MQNRLFVKYYYRFNYVILQLRDNLVVFTSSLDCFNLIEEMEKDLSSFLSPKSIAVVGASRTPGKVGAVVLRNILNSGFQGKIYAVNPNAQDIGGIQSFPDVGSLPEVVDLAIVSLPAELVNEVIAKIGEKGIKNVVVFSSGFKEEGGEGERREEELKGIAAKYQLNLLGPNCLGFVNTDVPLNATFGQIVNLPGNLRFISQSGALATSLFDWCESVGLGFSQFITLGNKTVLNENDFLQVFAKTTKRNANALNEGLSSVNPVGLYLESVSDGQEFVKLTAEICKTDPIIIIKPGKTKAAATAMQSHTGAIAGEDDIFAAALNQSGVARCDTLEEFFDLSRAFAWEETPKGERLAIISNAGGPAVISADAVSLSGLRLAEFDDETKNKLKEVLPRSASILNPVDVLGDALADRYAQAGEIILATDLADALLIILTPQMMTQVDKTAEVISSLSQKYKKPIFCSFIGGKMVAEGERILNMAKIPSFRFPERAIAAIGAMWRWRERQIEISKDTPVAALPEVEGSERIKEIVSKAVEKNSQSLDNIEANEVVASLGLPTPATALAANIEEAKNFADTNGWPVVLKLSAPGLLHKASAGGVVTDIWNVDQLEIAWDNLQHKKPELPEDLGEKATLQIQKDVTSGVEVIVGVKHDPTFGPVLLFGAGGHLAELVEDKNIKILPVDREHVKKLVGSSKVFKLLQNAPGEPPYALDKLYDLIARFTTLVPLIPEATDMEINPVIVTHNDVWAVDVKIMLAAGQAKKAGPKFHTATLTKKDTLASKYYYFEFESEEPLSYIPGQYVSVKVAPTRINSYSIAHADGENKFYLLVDTTPGGPGSKFFENIKPGDKMAYMGPFGVFTFKKDDGAKRLLFLGTGSGCSPIRSMLEAALKDPDTNVPIHFYFGLRHSDDVFWKEYFEKLSEEHPNFHFNLVLSKPDEAWHGQVGHVTDILKQELPDASDCSAYLCGNPNMIDEASTILKEKNCPEERIYQEKF
jgi:acetate---CoA ligase (ADP-forming)